MKIIGGQLRTATVKTWSLTVLYRYIVFMLYKKLSFGSHVRLSGLSSNFGTETILFDSRELPTTLMQLLAKMPNFSLAVWPGPGGQQKAKDKKEDGFVTKMIGKRCDD